MKKLLIVCLCLISAIGIGQELAGFTAGSSFRVACRSFFATPYITPDNLSTPDDCESEYSFPMIVLGKTTFLGLDYLIALDESQERLEEVSIVSTTFREYSRAELDDKIHSELYGLSQFFAQYFGDAQVVKQITSQSFDDGRDSIDVMKWQNGDYQAVLRVSQRKNTENFIIVAQVTDLNISAAREQEEVKTSAEVDKLLSLYDFSSTMYSKLGIIEIACPENVRQGVIYARCGYTSSGFELFKLKWDYELEFNDTLEDIEANSPWSLNDDDVFSRYMKVSNVPFTVYFVDGGVVIQSSE